MCILSPSRYLSSTPSTGIYSLSLHDALPIFALPLWHSRLLLPAGLVLVALAVGLSYAGAPVGANFCKLGALTLDRKSTRLNSSHMSISYAVFCLKKKKQALGADRGPDDACRG